MTNEPRYSSSDLARIVGCSRKAVRVYEAKGLLGPRGTSRSKRYGAPSIDRLRLVVGLRLLDMSIEDIAKILSLKANGHATVAEAARNIAAALGDTIRLIDERVEQLGTLRAQLSASRERLATDCASCDKLVEACVGCAEIGKLDPTARTLLLGN